MSRVSGFNPGDESSHNELHENSNSLSRRYREGVQAQAQNLSKGSLFQG